MPYKWIDFPQPNYASTNADMLMLEARCVPASSMFNGYSFNERCMLSLAVVDDDVQIGDQLTLIWGEPTTPARPRRSRTGRPKSASSSRRRPTPVRRASTMRRAGEPEPPDGGARGLRSRRPSPGVRGHPRTQADKGHSAVASWRRMTIGSSIRRTSIGRAAMSCGLWGSGLSRSLGALSQSSGPGSCRCRADRW